MKKIELDYLKGILDYDFDPNCVIYYRLVNFVDFENTLNQKLRGGSEEPPADFIFRSDILN